MSTRLMFTTRSSSLEAADPVGIEMKEKERTKVSIRNACILLYYLSRDAAKQQDIRTALSYPLLPRRSSPCIFVCQSSTDHVSSYVRIQSLSYFFSSLSTFDISFC